MRRSVTVALLAILLGLGLLSVPSVRSTFFRRMADSLDLDQRAICADYIVVLPGDSVRRSLTAAALFRMGLARQVLIPQNPDSADVQDGIILPTAQISRKILLHRGIPADRVLLLPSECRTTFDDAAALSRFLGAQDVNVMVVTSAFHTRRAAFVFRKVLDPVGGRLVVVSAPNPGFTAESWWTDRQGVRLVLTEYVKLAFYYLRYGSGAFLVWCVAAVAVTAWFVTRRPFRKAVVNCQDD